MSNDREELLARKQQLEGHGGRPQETPNQVIDAVIWKSRLTRLYYESLIKHGFSETDALYLTAHSGDL